MGHFWHNIPKAKLEEAADLLQAGESGLVIVAVNRHGTDITPLLSNAEETAVFETVAGDLQGVIDEELAQAKANASS